MGKYISELIDIGMGNVIDMSVDDVILKDEIYQKGQTDSGRLYEKFTSMLNEDQKVIFEDYLASVMSANERACNLAYLVGAKNTIQFLSEANALRGNVGI